MVNKFSMTDSTVIDHRYAECLSGSSLIEKAAKEQAIARLQAEWLVAD